MSFRRKGEKLVMANIKSQKKRIITNEKSRMRNRAIKSELKTATRRVKDAVEAGNGAEAYAAALSACRLMDKAVSKGVIKKNQAANRKSGVMKLANTIVTDEDRKSYKPKKGAAPQKTGNKKAEAKKQRAEELAKAQKEKDKRRAEHKKLEDAANKRKAKEEAAAKKAEEEAAKAEAEAADAEGEAAEGETEAPAEAPAEEANEQAAE